MMMTDPISDMLTRIRNGLHAGFNSVDVPSSNVKVEIAKILKKEGYILDYSVKGESAKEKVITITFKKNENGLKVIQGLKRISKPGLRVYAQANEIPYVLNGLGTAIISTSKGLLADKDARKANIGGEVVAYIW